MKITKKKLLEFIEEEVNNVILEKSSIRTSYPESEWLPKADKAASAARSSDGTDITDVGKLFEAIQYIIMASASLTGKVTKLTKAMEAIKKQQRNINK